MAVKVFIKRKVAQGKQEELLELIKRLRSQAVGQPGYISGETLWSASGPDTSTVVVISTWANVEDWEAWRSSKERRELQDRIDGILGQETTYDTYHYTGKERA